MYNIVVLLVLLLIGVVVISVITYIHNVNSVDNWVFIRESMLNTSKNIAYQINALWINNKITNTTQALQDQQIITTLENIKRYESSENTMVHTYIMDIEGKFITESTVAPIFSKEIINYIKDTSLCNSNTEGSNGTSNSSIRLIINTAINGGGFIVYKYKGLYITAYTRVISSLVPWIIVSLVEEKQH